MQKQSMCYAFACAELEESQSVLRSFHLMNKEDIAAIAATGKNI